jgi:HK97 family phage prohead protease
LLTIDNSRIPHGKFNLLQEDNKGLYFESMQLPNTTYSNDLIELYSMGIVKEHLIGFNTIKSDWQKDGITRIIKEVKLYEGSNVTLGANPNTPFTGFKARTEKEINDQVSLIIKAVRNGNFTDETFGQLEIALKMLQTEAYEFGKKALTDEPTEPVTTKDEPQILDILKTFKI